MLRYLRYELHKTLKTKTIWILVIAFLAIRAVDIITSILNDKMFPVMMYLSVHTNTAEIIFPIMGALVGAKEFSNGFMKNVYKQIKPSLFILSKFIALFVCVIIFMLIDFIYLYLANVAFGVEESLISNCDYPFSIPYLLTISIYYLTSAGIGMAVASLLNTEAVAVTIVLSWMFIYIYVYPIIGELVMNVMPSILVGPDNIADIDNIYRYLHFGGGYNLVMNYIRGIGVNPTNMPKVMNEILTFYIRETLYIVICYLICWLTLKRRRV